jgi:hypothetical protein
MAVMSVFLTLSKAFDLLKLPPPTVEEKNCNEAGIQQGQKRLQ